MSDVKSLTIHSTKYTIKDETARNNYSALNSTVTQQGSKITSIEGDVETNTQDIATLKSTVGQQTAQISDINNDIGVIKTDVQQNKLAITGHTKSISSINDTLATKVTGDYFYNNIVPDSDITIPQTPAFADAYSGTFFNASGGAYLFNITGLLFQTGTGNIEVHLFVDGAGLMVATIPTNENLVYGNCSGVVNVTPGNHTIAVKLRGTHGESLLKAYSGIYVNLVKIKNS